jgi:hypothetical protein
VLEIDSMKTEPGCVEGDRAFLWSWFSSVQAATHDKYEDRTRTAHDSGWDVSFWFAVSIPLLGVLAALPKNIAPTV